MYWMMKVGSPDGASLATIGKKPDLKPILKSFSWYAGNKISTELPQPLKMYLSASSGDFIPDFFMPPIPLMSRKMLKALREAGVDNVESYDAIIHDTAGKVIREDYFAINIIGVVSCANLERSKYQADDPNDTFGLTFDSLVIDENKAQGHKLFRLYEAVHGVVVHDSVKEVLERENLAGVYFVKPEDWSG